MVPTLRCDCEDDGDGVVDWGGGVGVGGDGAGVGVGVGVGIRGDRIVVVVLLAPMMGSLPTRSLLEVQCMDGEIGE